MARPKQFSTSQDHPIQTTVTGEDRPYKKADFMRDLAKVTQPDGKPKSAKS